MLIIPNFTRLTFASGLTALMATITSAAQTLALPRICTSFHQLILHFPTKLAPCFLPARPASTLGSLGSAKRWLMCTSLPRRSKPTYRLPDLRQNARTQWIGRVRPAAARELGLLPDSARRGALSPACSDVSTRPSRRHRVLITLSGAM